MRVRKTESFVLGQAVVLWCYERLGSGANFVTRSDDKEGYQKGVMMLREVLGII